MAYISEEPALPVEATPNPKPRKQVRHRTQSIDSPTRPTRVENHARMSTTPSRPDRILVKSPHHKNPDADYIPSLPALVLSAVPKRRAALGARSRRSATPIPPYEPPKDVFTPPREVFLTSNVPKSVSKSSKRKTPAASTKAKGLKILTAPSIIKQELPDIDLTAPMPPASPTDDPLLLSGPPEPRSTPIRRSPLKRMLSHGVQAQLDNLPPSSPMDDEEQGGATEGVNYFDWNHHTEPEGSTDFSMELDPADADVPPVQLFDLNPPDDAGGWSDSDDGENEDKMEGHGEYTGKWKMMKVRTKADPPSSATRGRMEQWGRPISPFPKVKKVNWLGGVVEEEQPSLAVEEAPQEQPEEEEQELLPEPEQTSFEQEDEERQEEEEVRRMSVEPDIRDESLEEPQNVSLDVDSSFGSHPEHIEDQTPDTSHSQEEGASIESQERSIEEADEEEDEEEREVRQMSVEHDPEEEENQNDLSAASISQEQAQEALPSVPSSLEGALPLRHASPADGPRNEILGVDSPIPFPYLAPSELSLTTHQPQLDENLVAALRDDDTFMHDVEPSPEQQVAYSDDEDSEDDSSDGDAVGVVKISSTDPRAAARAAAILKQHDYDCYTKITMKRRHSEMKRRRDSHSAVDELAKETRRRGASAAGVGKESREKKRRRSTLGMGVLGDMVFIPGSPATTLPKLLAEAEAEVVRMSPVKGSLVREGFDGVGHRDPFKTPLPRRVEYLKKVSIGSRKQVDEHSNNDEESRERIWTKEDWKQLDGCFTDERLAIGHRLSAEFTQDGLAPVDMVQLSDVVERFLVLMGGLEVVETYGGAWERDCLTQRVHALQNKQRSGKVAPPTTPHVPNTSGFNALEGGTRIPFMEVPDFTPLGRRAPPPRTLRPAFPSPVVEDAPFANVAQEKERKRKAPASLLAPRYSHLLEEAIAISQDLPPLTSTLRMGKNTLEGEAADQSYEEEHIMESFEEEHTADAYEEENTQESFEQPQTPATIGNRVKGFFFSYLPTLSKTAPPVHKRHVPRQPGLPLPPLEVLEKSRGPITTPVRPPLPKVRHPKEMVHLHPAPQPQPKSSLIPRARKPQRLVDLHPLPAPPPPPEPIPRPRRSSGGSVKDLVRGFEDLKKNTLNRWS